MNRWTRTSPGAIDARPAGGLARRFRGVVGTGMAVALLLLLLPLLSGVTRAADSWSAEDLAQLAAMSIDRLPSPPPDPSNAVADVAAAAAFGQRLFAETGFSRNQAVACATCHVPHREFQDGLPVGQGVGTGARRTMPIAGAAHGPWLFWDGRKDSLWSQALGPLEDAVEHGGNRTRIAQVLQARYRSEYEMLFGRMPDLAGLPGDAGPLGSDAERSAWQRMDPRQRADVNRIFANAGKAIAAYERTLTPGESRFDRYVRAVVAGDREGARALSAQEVRGLRLFLGKGQCATCHGGPLLTDLHFHNTGVPQRDPARIDRGRAAATVRVQHDEFNCLGAFSDAPQEACAELRFMVTDHPAAEGAFKTPGLRNVALRAPYMHAGQFATLEDVVAHYRRSPPATVGRSELAPGADARAERKPIRLDEAEARDIAAFLRALSDERAGAQSPR